MIRKINFNKDFNKENRVYKIWKEKEIAQIWAIKILIILQIICKQLRKEINLNKVFQINKNKSHYKIKIVIWIF